MSIKNVYVYSPECEYLLYCKLFISLQRFNTETVGTKARQLVCLLELLKQ